MGGVAYIENWSDLVYDLASKRFPSSNAAFEAKLHRKIGSSATAT